jgi:hypothetical protein
VGWGCKDACPPSTAPICIFVIILFLQEQWSDQQLSISSKDSVIIYNRSRLLCVTLYMCVCVYIHTHTPTYLCRWLLRFWRACWLHIDIAVQDSGCHKTEVSSTCLLFTVRTRFMISQLGALWQSIAFVLNHVWNSIPPIRGPVRIRGIAKYYVSLVPIKAEYIQLN